MSAYRPSCEREEKEREAFGKPVDECAQTFWFRGIVHLGAAVLYRWYMCMNHSDFYVVKY